MSKTPAGIYKVNSLLTDFSLTENINIKRRSFYGKVNDCIRYNYCTNKIPYYTFINEQANLVKTSKKWQNHGFRYKTVKNKFNENIENGNSLGVNVVATNKQLNKLGLEMLIVDLDKNGFNFIKKFCSILGTNRMLKYSYSINVNGKDKSHFLIISYQSYIENIKEFIKKIANKTNSKVDFTKYVRMEGIDYHVKNKTKNGYLPYFIHPEEYKTKICKYIGRESTKTKRQGTTSEKGKAAVRMVLKEQKRAKMGLTHGKEKIKFNNIENLVNKIKNDKNISKTIKKRLLKDDTIYRMLYLVNYGTNNTASELKMNNKTYANYLNLLSQNDYIVKKANYVFSFNINNSKNTQYDLVIIKIKNNSINCSHIIPVGKRHKTGVKLFVNCYHKNNGKIPDIDFNNIKHILTNSGLGINEILEIYKWTINKMI